MAETHTPRQRKPGGRAEAPTPQEGSMAVYKRSYRAYSGPLTNPMWRFLVLQRYAMKGIFRSRFLLIGYVGCFFLPVLAICAIYLNQNAAILAQINSKPGFLKIDGNFFMVVLQAQGSLAGLLTAFVGPSLIAPDLTNGALPLYLSRPISRTEYILGKAMVLGSLIASITLIPTLLMFVVQSSLLAILVFRKSIPGQRHPVDKPADDGTLHSAGPGDVRPGCGGGRSRGDGPRGFVAGKGFAAVINAAMRTEAGYYLDLQHLLSTVAGALAAPRRRG